MKKFMADDFLLSTATAAKLFEYVRKVPVIDYHCHISPMEIAQDKKFKNITQAWLYGDHYKWRLMRARGVDEKYITGNAGDREKFQKWAETLETAIGNPLYHWSHLELSRYFGINFCLNSDTADQVWEITSKRLAESDMSVRGIIRQSNVKLICSTDDPADSLEYHKLIAEDPAFETQVIPAMRPDKAMNIEKTDFTEYLKKLSAAAEIKIDSFRSLKEALSKRMDFFSSMGCLLSDHALPFVMYAPASDDRIEEIFSKKLSGGCVTPEEVLKYKTAFMIFAAGEYSKRDWTMQLHFGCRRDNNTLMYEKIGADTGYDCIDNYAPASQLSDFLNALEKEKKLGRVILYSLNPSDNAMIASVIGCFNDSSAVGKIQQGSAWWFNDNIKGMKEQMTMLASIGNLSTFVGMLTDSRSFLSYTRHEYFRRILCDVLGNWVENGEFPEDLKNLEKITKGISYNNAVDYFKLKLEKV